jgi:parallel beta-helix repeat protein
VLIIPLQIKVEHVSSPIQEYRRNPKISFNHNPISINGNKDFNQTFVTSGNGTITNPYIIENYTISASKAHGIQIKDTNAYFIVRNVTVSGGRSNYNFGFFLENVSKGYLINNTSIENIAGFVVRDSTNNSLQNNKASNNFHGYRLWNSNNNTLKLNKGKNNLFYEIFLDNSHFNKINRNKLLNEIYSNQITTGVHLFNSTNNILKNNTGSNFNSAISLENSEWNLLFRNNVTENQNGISIFNSHKINITQNYAFNNTNGYYLFNSSWIILKNNTGVKNQNGIHLLNSTQNNLTYNYMEKNRVGLFIEESPNNSIRNNSFWNDGLLISSITVENSLQTMVKNNSINNKPLIYHENKHNEDISEIAGQVILINCSSIKIEDTIVENSTTGFLLLFSTNISMHGNIAKYNNLHGFWLKFSDNNSLIENIASYNKRFGIYLESSSSNSIIKNVLLGNRNGTYSDLGNNNFFDLNIIDEDAYLPGDSIFIASNYQFEVLAVASNWPGNGINGDPYIIEDFVINQTGTYGIKIQNTNIHFIIRNITLNGSLTFNHYAIYLKNVTNAKIENLNIFDKHYGIFLSD